MLRSNLTEVGETVLPHLILLESVWWYTLYCLWKTRLSTFRMILFPGKLSSPILLQFFYLSDFQEWSTNSNPSITKNNMLLQSLLFLYTSSYTWFTVEYDITHPLSTWYDFPCQVDLHFWFLPFNVVLAFAYQWRTYFCSITNYLAMLSNSTN